MLVSMKGNVTMPGSVVKGAILEAHLSRDWALYDVSHLLPKHRWKKPRRLRRTGPAERLYHHHSGAYGRDGFRGLLNATRYVIRARNMTGCPYPFWNARVPDIDHDGHYAIYRGVPEMQWAPHSGGLANHHGEALAWQGNLRRMMPTALQYEGAEALCDWWMQQHPRAEVKPISMHSESGEFGGRSKSVCPGRHVAAWVEGYRSKT